MTDGRSEPDYGQETGSEGDLDYLETIALLQDEIARLESELLAQQDLAARSSLGGHSRTAAEADGVAADRHHLEQMAAELAAREETINLLLEQLRLVEEAESASRLEWEQLSEWVSEVEERLERQAETAAGQSAQELETQRRALEESRARLGVERQAWTTQRRDLENEIARLQSLLAQTAKEGAGSGDRAGMELLESENQRLMKQCQELQKAAFSEMESLRQEVEAARQGKEEARKTCEQVQDERDRERREYEIAITSIRAVVSGGPRRARERTGRRPARRGCRAGRRDRG